MTNSITALSVVITVEQIGPDQEAYAVALEGHPSVPTSWAVGMLRQIADGLAAEPFAGDTPTAADLGLESCCGAPEGKHWTSCPIYGIEHLQRIVDGYDRTPLGQRAADAIASADAVIRAVLTELGKGPDTDPVLAVRALVASIPTARADALRQAANSPGIAGTVGGGRFADELIRLADIEDKRTP